MALQDVIAYLSEGRYPPHLHLLSPSGRPAPDAERVSAVTRRSALAAGPIERPRRSRAARGGGGGHEAVEGLQHPQDGLERDAHADATVAHDSGAIVSAPVLTLMFAQASFFCWLESARAECL